MGVGLEDPDSVISSAEGCDESAFRTEANDADDPSVEAGSAASVTAVSTGVLEDAGSEAEVPDSAADETVTGSLSITGEAAAGSAEWSVGALLEVWAAALLMDSLEAEDCEVACLMAGSLEIADDEHGLLPGIRETGAGREELRDTREDAARNVTRVIAGRMVQKVPGR